LLFGAPDEKIVHYFCCGNPGCLDSSSGAAITVELAKKCRQMAIDSHPPPIRPGNKAYAEAERSFFQECVKKNGDMRDDGSPQNNGAPKGSDTPK